jgi:hypothetical protein
MYWSASEPGLRVLVPPHAVRITKLSAVCFFAKKNGGKYREAPDRYLAGKKKEAHLSRFQVSKVFSRTAYRIVTVNKQFEDLIRTVVELFCEILYTDKADVLNFYRFCGRHFITI